MSFDRLSIMQRLPQFYRWQGKSFAENIVSCQIKSQPEEGVLTGLRLLEFGEQDVRVLMERLSQCLDSINVDNAVAEWDSELCLFIRYKDEAAVFRCLKTLGVAIAESTAIGNFENIF